jgi:hypothetical protein
MYKFQQDIHDLLKLNPVTINHLNISIISNKIEAVIKNVSTKKSPGPHGFTTQFYVPFKEELKVILLKLF